MLSPDFIIKQYISSRLDECWNIFSIKYSPEIKPTWNVRFNEQLNLYYTSFAFKISDVLHLSPEYISNSLQKHVDDPLGYFTDCYSSNGYINFTINTELYFKFMPMVHNWLSHKPNTQKSAEVKCFLSPNINKLQIIRAQVFAKATQNLLEWHGYQTNLLITSYFEQKNSQIKIISDTHNITKIIGPVNSSNTQWDNINNNYSKDAITYVLLSNNINQPCGFNSKDLMLNIDNPIYLLTYIKSKLSTINSHDTLNYGGYNQLLARKLSYYPQLLHSILKTFDINKIFMYLHDICRLTFECGLWQNCNEKISSLILLKDVIDHALNITNCKFSQLD